jgi:hypothetical protein
MIFPLGVDLPKISFEVNNPRCANIFVRKTKRKVDFL